MDADAGGEPIGLIWQWLAAVGIDTAGAARHGVKMAFTLTPRTALGTMRCAVGAISLLAPLTAQTAFGVASHPSSAWITRLFGSRELVLAATLLAAPPEHVYPVAALGAGIDALDVASSAVELARGRISVYTFVSGGCGAALFAVLGLTAARQARAKPPSVAMK